MAEIAENTVQNKSQSCTRMCGKGFGIFLSSLSPFLGKIDCSNVFYLEEHEGFGSKRAGKRGLIFSQAEIVNELSQKSACAKRAVVETEGVRKLLRIVKQEWGKPC